MDKICKTFEENISANWKSRKTTLVEALKGSEEAVGEVIQKTETRQ